jgi:hypothetical protein
MSCSCWPLPPATPTLVANIVLPEGLKVSVLFDQSVLAEGTELDDPAGFFKRLNKLTLALAGSGAPKIWTPGT